MLRLDGGGVGADWPPLPPPPTDYRPPAAAGCAAAATHARTHAHTARMHPAGATDGSAGAKGGASAAPMVRGRVIKPPPAIPALAAALKAQVWVWVPRWC